MEYADSELENASDAQKHLMRMGPGNTERVQRKLREIAAILDPGLQLPPPEAFEPRTSTLR